MSNKQIVAIIAGAVAFVAVFYIVIFVFAIWLIKLVWNAV